MEQNRESLCKSITAEQRAVLETYIDCSEELLLQLMERAFCDGFCLASKLMLEALS